MPPRPATRVVRIPRVYSLEFASPDDVLDLHAVFDLASRVQLESNFDPDLGRSVVAAFSLLGLDAPALTASPPPTAGRETFIAALKCGAGHASDRMAAMLWRQRIACLRHAWSWNRVIEGDPILTSVPRSSVDQELRDLSASVFEVAQRGVDVAHTLDARLAATYGAPRNPEGQALVTPFRYRDLAAREPAAMRLSSLFEPKDFAPSGASSAPSSPAHGDPSRPGPTG